MSDANVELLFCVAFLHIRCLAKEQLTFVRCRLSGNTLNRVCAQCAAYLNAHAHAHVVRKQM